jgi:type II secretory pathway pseudopilin PulG
MRLTREGRGGFTLVELLIGIILAGITGLALTRMIMTTQRISRAQTQQTDLQSAVRTGALLLPAELREIGYDETTGGAVVPDILDARADRLTVRVMRGWGVICGNYSETEILVRLPIIGYRNPTTADSLLLFTENEADRGNDDQWTPFRTNEIRQETCPDGDRALQLRQLSPNTPDFFDAATNSGNGMPIGTRIRNGSPIRFFEVMEYSLYQSDGRWWLGAQSRTAGDAAPQPVLGPLRAGNGFALRYFDRDEALINPGDAARYRDIRVIEITLRGETSAPVARSDRGGLAIKVDSLVTRVALRNALRP